MNAIILMDSDSSIYQSCLCKKEDSEDGKGFIYDLEEAQHKFEEKVYSIINTIEQQYQFNVIHTILFLEGKGNYRYGLNKHYKANRKKVEMPPILPHLSRWIRENFNKESQPLSTFSSVNVETDDSLAATYKKYKVNDFETQIIVASPDKDLKTIPCLLFDTYYSRMELSSITEFEAWKNLMEQMIVGDNADGVKGLPKKGVKYAESLFKGLTREIEVTYATWLAYKEFYGVKAKTEWYKNYYSLKLNDGNIMTPDLESLMF